MVNHIPLDPEERKEARDWEIEYGDRADCAREGKRFLIRISLRANPCIWDVTDALLHEWAHARTWKHEALERRHRGYIHTPEYWLGYGEIFCAYYEDGGYRESEDY
jgi:hypothetical protein